MVIKEFFSVPILSVVAGSSVAFRSPVVERFHWYCDWCMSMQVSSAWESGDYEGARNNSRKARTWSVVSIISHVVFGVAAGVVFFIIIIAQ